jgi:hypothetical protein
MSASEASKPHSCAFCHVERRNGADSRHFVVHARAPRFVVEIEADAESTNGRRPGVIRRVWVPNSWAGDYHESGSLLGAALRFHETIAPRADPHRGRRGTS